MKAKIILLSVLFLSVLFLATNVFALCTDSDVNDEYPNGINPYENGEIYFKSPYAQDWQSGMYTYDSCSNNILYERYCGVNGSTIETEEITCPEGYKCEIDKCIGDDEEYTEDIEGDGEGSSSPGGGGGQGGGCFDTDGGKDIFEKGISAGVYDSCISKYKINERYCTENNVGADYVGECPSGYICSDGACIESDEDDGDDTTSTTTYFKNCNYIWDSSPYINQTVKITASIKDSSGSVDSDSVEVNVLESVLGGTGGAYPIDGKKLDIQIIQPGEGAVAGAVEIKINSKGPNELGEMSLGLSGDRWGAGFPISNKNCVAGGSGGGGSGSGGTSSSCEKYHICEDGTEVQYCEIVKQYDEDGNVVGAGCGCKSNPEKLCSSSSSGGGSGEPTEIPSSGGGGGSGRNNETPIICNGCILGDKCVPVGYRTDDKYCNIESELVSQFNAEESCNNNFECSTNLCIDNQCVSSGVWQKFVRWLSRLFG